MSDDARVIWKKGGGQMPEKAQYVVDVAQGELLLQTLNLPEAVENTLRYNADKDAQSVNDYVSRILIERLRSVS
jgi:hypothetical protein